MAKYGMKREEEFIIIHGETGVKISYAWQGLHIWVIKTSVNQLPIQHT